MPDSAEYRCPSGFRTRHIIKVAHGFRFPDGVSAFKLLTMMNKRIFSIKDGPGGSEIRSSRPVSKSFKMSKTIRLFTFLTMFLTIFSSCDTEGEDIIMGFSSCNVQFSSQQGINVQNYEIKFNGNTSKNGQINGKKGEKRKLEVFEKGSKEPIFQKDITLGETKDIELIKTVNNGIDILSDRYVPFTPAILYSGDEADYTATFDGGELMNNRINYLASDHLKGVLKIVRNKDGMTLYENEFALTPNGKINVMQLSDTDFLEIPETDEPAPESKQFTKIRFFYTADAFPGKDELQLVVYLMSLNADQFSDPVATIDLKAGELSKYIQIDNNYFGEGKINAVYDLIDKDGNKIVDNTIHLNTMIPIGTTDYKFMTFRFIDPSHQGGDNVGCGDIKNLDIPWE